MARLLYSRLSPYAAKARMAVAHVAYPAESVLTETWEPDAAFLAANPLGKIPVLIAQDGMAIHDSRVIVNFLDRWSGGRLWPSDAEARLRAEMLEALADGVCDCLQAIMSERRFKPAERQHAPWIERQWIKVARTLDRLEQGPPDWSPSPHAGHIALRGMFGYLGVRFDGEWQPGRPRLVRWVEDFDAAFPHMAACAPRF